MPATLRVTVIQESDENIEVFGQLVFSGNYSTGGDTLTFDFSTANTAGLNVYQQVKALHASRPPILFSAQLDAQLLGGGSAVNVLPQTSGFAPKIQAFTSSTELTGAQAYPDAWAIDADDAQQSVLWLRYKKNI